MIAMITAVLTLGKQEQREREVAEDALLRPGPGSGSINVPAGSIGTIDVVSGPTDDEDFFQSRALQ
ncbi:hypothetical protein C0992_008370, partial [Termitomyces sp. T32_za158]